MVDLEWAFVARLTRFFLLASPVGSAHCGATNGPPFGRLDVFEISRLLRTHAAISQKTPTASRCAFLMSGDGSWVRQRINRSVMTSEHFTRAIAFSYRKGFPKLVLSAANMLGKFLQASACKVQAVIEIAGQWQELAHQVCRNVTPTTDAGNSVFTKLAGIVQLLFDVLRHISKPGGTGFSGLPGRRTWNVDFLPITIHAVPFTHSHGGTENGCDRDIQAVLQSIQHSLGFIQILLSRWNHQSDWMPLKSNRSEIQIHAPYSSHYFWNLTRISVFDEGRNTFRLSYEGWT